MNATYNHMASPNTNDPHAYPEMLAMIADGRLRPGRLVQHWIGLDHAPEALMGMGDAPRAGVTVIRPNG